LHHGKTEKYLIGLNKILMNNIINVKIPRRDYDTMVISRKHGRIVDFEFDPDKEVGDIGERIIVQIYEQLGFEFVEYNNDEDKKNLKLWDIKVIKDFIEKLLEGKNEGRIRPWYEYSILILHGSLYYPIHESTGDNSCNQDTGNLFIEMESWNKQAGPEISKADYFVYLIFFFNQVWIIKMDDLRKIIEDGKDIPIGCGGQGGTAKGYLIKREEYRDKFTVIDLNYEIVEDGKNILYEMEFDGQVVEGGILIKIIIRLGGVIVADINRVVEKSETSDEIAQYTALYKGLDNCRRMGIKYICVYGNNQKIIDQMNAKEMVIDKSLPYYKSFFETMKLSLENFKYKEYNYK
jgi:hypothetical protein